MWRFDGYFDNVEELKLNLEENVLNSSVHLFLFYRVSSILSSEHDTKPFDRYAFNTRIFRIKSQI